MVGNVVFCMRQFGELLRKFSQVINRSLFCLISSFFADLSCKVGKLSWMYATFLFRFLIFTSEYMTRVGGIFSLILQFWKKVRNWQARSRIQRGPSRFFSLKHSWQVLYLPAASFLRGLRSFWFQWALTPRLELTRTAFPNGVAIQISHGNKLTVKSFYQFFTA